MLAPAAFPSLFLTLSGFILLLLVTLSVPIIKTIYLLHVESALGATVANAGVLGFCYPGGSASFAGIHYSTTAHCTNPKVAYELDPTFLGYSVGSDVGKDVSRGLAGSLILNAVACGLAGLSLFWAFFAWFCSSRILEIITFLSLLLSALIAWLSWALDLAIVLVFRHRVNHDTNGAFSGHIGNAVWLALAGAVALTFALCAAGCGCFGRYSSRYADAPPPPAKYGRRYPWQRSAPMARGTY